MDSTAPLLIFYARNDALGDGLLRIPALRAARTAFPRSHIVYGSLGRSSLTGVLRRHVAPLVDDFRTVLPRSPLEELHRRMMRERSSGALAQEVSEAELLARYGVPRGVIRKLLMRFAAEGLAHRLPGHGWRFVDTLVGEQAFNESYEFRMVIECAALRSPTFMT